MNTRFKLGIAFTFIVLTAPGYGLCYDVPNHHELSTAAVSKSTLASSETLARYWLQPGDLFPSTPGMNSGDFIGGCAHSKKFQIGVLIGCGAQFEDVPVTRSLNHFYDPLSNWPLKVRFPPLVGPWVTPGPIVGLPNLTSPDWSLKDVANPEQTQVHAYKEARDYFMQALTITGSRAARDEAWGKLFQTLGHVIHHLQDMAQPAHVRNDAHLTIPIPLYFNPSLFETFSAEDETREFVDSYLSGQAAEPNYPSNGIAFSKPRHFWSNPSATGLAQHINASFVSAGTNFEIRSGSQVATTRYVQPQPGSLVSIPVANLDLDPSDNVGRAIPPDILELCSNGLPCAMDFYSTGNGTPEYNPRASALSIFDQYVQLRPVLFEDPTAGQYQVDRFFTLNRYTFARAYPRLLPKAVSYSAGLINYFFRGRLAIDRPAEGVYAVVDHGAARATGGFSKFRANVRNATPNPDSSSQDPVEVMANTPDPGGLFAVVKFRRNTDYAADLSREYGSEAPGSPGVRSLEDEWLISTRADVPAAINSSAGADVTFTFNPPIPISATDLHLQIIYRGPLGSEPDGIAVETKDISEPTYYPIFDLFEQQSYSPTGQTWRSAYCDDPVPPLPPMASYEECKVYYARSYYLRFAAPTGFDPENAITTFNALVTMPNIKVSAYPRIAILTDTTPFNAYTLNTVTNPPAWGMSTFTPAINQLGASPMRYRQARGVFVEDLDYNDLTQGTLLPPYPPISPLEPQTSNIAAPF